MRASRITCLLGALALLAGASACGDDGPSAEVKADFMMRWNAIAKKPDRTFEFLGQRGNVGWETFGEFPHPTYRGGSGPAYQTFAGVLADFLDSEDNFEFLTQHRLFRYPLPYDPTEATTAPTTLVEMAELVSEPGHFANVPAATRTKLRQQLDRIARL